MIVGCGLDSSIIDPLIEKYQDQGIIATVLGEEKPEDNVFMLRMLSGLAIDVPELRCADESERGILKAKRAIRSQASLAATGTASNLNRQHIRRYHRYR